jgi:beta-phosphoglucomutase
MISGCIFDLDGVIVDTAHYHYSAWKRLANGLGFDFTHEDNERLKGVSRMASLDILLEIGGLTLSPERKIGLAAQKNSWYLEYISRMSPDDLLPGVERFLEILQNAGIRLALGTASRNAGAILARTGITGYFDAVVDGTRVVNAKPDPEVFLTAAADLHLKPTDCLVFEDAIAGVEAARLARMRCIGVGDPKVLVHADKVIPGFTGANLDLIDY